MSPHHRIGMTVGLALLLATPNLRSQEPSGFVEQIDVQVVNVDVYVTDRDGNPVIDLDKQDFTLEVDGRPVEITNFRAVIDEPTRLRSAAGAVRADREPASGGDDEPPAPLTDADLSEDQQLWILIYVDNYNLEAIHRNRVLRELTQFLSRQQRPTDKVMIVSYERSLNLRHSFDEPAAEAVDTLLEMQEMATFGEPKQAEWEESLALIEDARTFQDAFGWAESHAEYMQNERAFTLQALNGYVDDLRGLPGRKALIYVSDGLPLRAGDSLFQAIDYRFRGGNRGDRAPGSANAILSSFSYDASRDLERLAQKAGAAQVAFFPVDAAGQRAPIMLDPQYGDLQVQGMGTLVGSVRKANLQASLTQMAEKTGGQAFINRTRVLPGLEEIERSLRSYYSLGFTPQHYGDGRFRSLRVAVDRKGVDVRHRQGYRALSLNERLADRVEAALVYGYSDAGNDLELRTRPATPDGNRFVLPIEVRIPLGLLTFVPHNGGGGEAARVQIALGTADSQGDRSPIEQAPIDIVVPPQDVGRIDDKFYTAEFEMLMKGGPHKVVVVVHDLVSGQAWAESTAVDVQ